MSTTSTEAEKASLLSNILAIVGFIILIVIVIWGLFHLGSFSKSWFASLFPSVNSIQITVPATKVPSGKPVVISWKYSPKDKGAYTFLYQCHSGFQFKTQGAGGTSAIPCGAAFAVPGAKNSLSVTPILSGTSSLSVPLSIVFMPTASGTRAEGSTSLAVTAASSKNTAVATTSTYQNPDATGLPDLTVQILSTNTDASGMTAATFDIANAGDASTGTWYFTAQLPTAPAYTYVSDAQASLAPGAHIENTLRFTQATPGSVFTVSVDPSNFINESNESNNIASQNI